MVMRYQIKDWDKYFQNYKSRERDVLNWVSMPNKQDGLGFRRILSHPQGAAHFGIWCLTLQRCSRQRHPRDGWLTEDGRKNGTPWVFHDLKLLWGIDTQLIFDAYEVFCSEKVGWMQAHGATALAGGTAVSLQGYCGIHGGKEGGKEEEEQREEPVVLEQTQEEPPPETASRVYKRKRPADLRRGLEDTWRTIAKNHGGDIANSALHATKRIYGATFTHGQMNKVYQAAYEGGYLEHDSLTWADPRIKRPKPITSTSQDDYDPLSFPVGSQGKSSEETLEVLKTLFCQDPAPEDRQSP